MTKLRASAEKFKRMHLLMYPYSDTLVLTQISVYMLIFGQIINIYKIALFIKYLHLFHLKLAMQHDKNEKGIIFSFYTNFYYSTIYHFKKLIVR